MMKPCFFLSIRDNSVWIDYDNKTKRLRSYSEFISFLQSKASELGLHIHDLHVRSSGQLNFPRQYTKNPDTIALAKRLRR